MVKEIIKIINNDNVVQIIILERNEYKNVVLQFESSPLPAV